MYSDDELNSIHNKILEQLSKHPKCANFILTKSQLDKATNDKQIINKPYVIERYRYNDDPKKQKNNINIYEFVLDKLKKYKIVGIKTGNYGEYKGTHSRPGGSGFSWNDTNIYIIFINIHGECYCNTTLEYAYNTLSSSNGYSERDWFLEFFIKPFSIQPQSLRNRIPQILSPYNATYGDLQWMKYIDPEKYNDMDQPKYKEYISSENIIPINIMNEYIINKLDVKVKNNCYHIYVEYKQEEEKKLKQQKQEQEDKLKQQKEKELKENKERNRIQSWEKIMGVPYKYTNIKCDDEDFDTTVLNLSDEIEITKKKFIDCKLIKYTDRSFIRINDGNFKTINLNCKGVKIISLYNCNKFEELTGQFKEDILKLYIDGKLYFYNNKIIKKQLQSKITKYYYCKKIKK
jgi:hypothetical protein